MTWFSPAVLAHGDATDVYSLDSWASWSAPAGLGSSLAGGWTWDAAHDVSARCVTVSRAPSEEGARLRAPRDILARMAGAAGALGRSESEIWVEAAREWLSRHEPAGAPGGGQLLPAGPSSANVQRGRRSRVWREIDGVLEHLRDTHRTCASGEPGAA